MSCQDCIFWKKFSSADNDYGWGIEESTKWGLCFLAYGPQHRVGYDSMEYYITIDESDLQVQMTRAAGAPELPPLFVEDASFNKAYLVTRETFGCTEWALNPNITVDRLTDPEGP